MANDDFSEPPRRADSKNAISFFSRFLGLGHHQGLGVRLGRILGVLSIEPFLGGGGSGQRALSTPPSPGNENPASQGGLWNPNVCVPTMAQPGFANGKCRCFPRYSLWSGGVGSRGVTPPLPPPAVCGLSFLALPNFIFPSRRSFWGFGWVAGLCLKGRGAIGGIPERVQSGHRALGGGYWRLEMRLGPVLGYGTAFGVESGPECWEGGGSSPLLKRFPGGWVRQTPPPPPRG